MFDFYASDLGTQLIVNSKHYWQNEKANCCIIVPDSVTEPNAVALNKNVLLVFIQIEPGKSVQCTSLHNPELSRFTTDSDIVFECVSFKRENGKVVRPENCGGILDAIFDLIDARSWSFPRTIGTCEEYIPSRIAELLELDFKRQIFNEVPRDSVFTAISRAGTLLAERMGIHLDFELQASHYDMKTNTQIDNQINITSNCNLSSRIFGKPVVVIDDLISSGRTARAVRHYLAAKGPNHIFFYALYKTVASQEVCINDSGIMSVHSHTPISNAYWTYGRGFDLTDASTRDYPSIYAATKHWHWERDQDVDELIEFFDGIPLECYKDEQ